jgi:molecular chaperone GrpE
MTGHAKKPQDQAAKPASSPQTASQVKATDPVVRMQELEKKVQELSEQLKRVTEVASRAQAELLNAKSRMEKDATEIRKFAAEMVFRKLLPTIDNLQRALKHLPADLSANGGSELVEWTKGIVVLEQDFLKQVGEMGLKRFESVGHAVDPERHEVLMAVPGEAGKVIEVIEEGYELHGKVLRPAKVKVGGGA